MDALPPDYLGQLEVLATLHPGIADALVHAEQLRKKRLREYLGGMRLAGLETLHTYLNAAYESYVSTPALAHIAFLVRRVKSDYETALEATLSGFTGVATDVMRDVMETEGLLLDFALNDGHMQEWLLADRSTLLGRFSPGAVRKRLREGGVPPYSDEGFEPVDYRAHSQALHVSPPGSGFAHRGIDRSDPGSVLDDLGFLEMFEHGYRIMSAIELLRVVTQELEPGGYEPLVDRSAFDAAYERTQEMQVIVIAMVAGPTVLRERLGREAKTSELLRYIAHELVAKSPRSPELERRHDRP